MHIDEHVLAGIALDEPDPLDPEQQRHLQSCRACQTDLSELRAVATVGRDDPVTVQAPSPDLLDRIDAELAGGPGPAPVPAVPAGRTTPTPAPGRTRRLVLLAAAVGLVVGVGATAAYARWTQPEDVVLAATALAPLPGQTASGRAELVREDGVATLRVRLDTTTPADDFHELWLINTDGRRMISLGVLAPSGRGSYPLPSQLGDGLQDYTIVDVSLEPYDGNATHSLDSVARGTLP